MHFITERILDRAEKIIGPMEDWCQGARESFSCGRPQHCAMGAIDLATREIVNEPTKNSSAGTFTDCNFFEGQEAADLLTQAATEMNALDPTSVNDGDADVYGGSKPAPEVAHQTTLLMFQRAKQLGQAA